MEGHISTAWLEAHLGDERMRLLDMRGKFDVYEDGHVPGAQLLHLETLRMSEEGVPCKMHDIPVLAAIFGRLGITVDTPVIAYATRPLDHVNATYALWSLAVTGNPNISILDGGMKKWMAEARPTTKAYPSITPAHYTARFDTEIFADWLYVRDHLGDPGVALVDSRSVGQYEGREGTMMRLGHIPGAVLHNYIWDFGPDGAYRPAAYIRERYERKGITPDKEVITYCVTGREGSANWFMLKYLLGYPRVRLYQASMTEWAAKPELPLVTGPQPWGEAGARKAA